MQRDEPYNYQHAGFNGFFRRTLNSNLQENSLRGIGSMRAYKPQELNFDALQTGGALGDVLRVGPRVEIDGSQGRIDIKDTEGNPNTRIGEQED